MLEPIIRQLILYSLPVVISISIVGLVQARQQKLSAFYAFSGHGGYLPFLIGIVLHRGVLIALPRMYQPSIKQAALHLSTHLLLCLLGYILYQWTLPHAASYGLPPLHHWWAKVLMFYNLCMVLLHVMPLPNLLVGELLLPHMANYALVCRKQTTFVVSLCVALALLDISIGTWFIYPTYEHMAHPLSLEFISW